MPGGGDGLAGGDSGGDVEVEFEELGEEVFFGGEAVGGQYGGVERGVGILERILAGEFERAIDGPEAARNRTQSGFPHTPYFTPRRSHSVDQLCPGRLRPRESVP